MNYSKIFEIHTIKVDLLKNCEKSSMRIGYGNRSVGTCLTKRQLKR